MTQELARLLGYSEADLRAALELLGAVCVRQDVLRTQGHVEEVQRLSRQESKLRHALKRGAPLKDVLAVVK